MAQEAWGTIAWLKETTGIKHPDTLKTKILFPFRKELESFVRYPNKKGEPWKFHKDNMQNWLDKNFYRVWGR